MTKKCLTCKSKVIGKMESDTEDVIPDWYKRLGNYSLLPPILNNKKKYNALKTTLKKETPEITDTEVKVPLSITKNTWVFYWASSSTKKPLKINDPEKAYHKHENHGLVKTNSSGHAELILNCPQPYQVDEITYPRHLHYVVLNSDKLWSTEVKTIVVTCNIKKKDLEEIIKEDTHIIINALPEKTFETQHIPTSINIPYSSVTSKNQKKIIHDAIKKGLQGKHKLNRLLKKGTLDLENIPLVVYCAHEDCNASEQLIHVLIDTGFVNIIEFPGGIKEWFGKKLKKEKKKRKSTKRKPLKTPKRKSRTKKKKQAKKIDDIMDNKETMTFFDTDDEDKDEEKSSHSKYNLDISDETIIYENVPYKHVLYTSEILHEDVLMGHWDGKKIKWIGENEEKHKQLNQIFTNKIKDDIKHKEKGSQEIEEESSDDEEENSSDGEEEEEKEEEKEEKSSDDEEEEDEEEKEEESSDDEEEEDEEEKEEKSSDDEEEDDEEEEKSSDDEEEKSSDDEEEEDDNVKNPKLVKLRKILKDKEKLLNKEGGGNFETKAINIKNGGGFRGWGFTFN